MTTADYFVEILKLILPAGMVLIGVAIILNNTNRKQESREKNELRMEALSRIVPLRLQAYERGVLFLERISPENLVLRVNPQGKNMRQFHAELLSDIRSEYEHNMAQQLYVSNEAWFELVRAKEQIISLINTATGSLPPTASGAELGKRIMEMLMKAEAAPARQAISVFKADIQRSFRI